MQAYTQISEAFLLTNSRQMLLDNDQTVATMFSGTAFPLTNLVLDMWCFRTDLKQMFQLTALTPVWTMQFDLNSGARRQPDLTTGGVSPALTLTPLKPIAAYLTGQSFNVTFSVASAASQTLQISGVITPPSLVKRLGDGTYANIAAGDFSAGHTSAVTLISPTQVWIEQLPNVAVVNGGTGANTPAAARANLGATEAGNNATITNIAAVTTIGGVGVIGYRDVPQVTFSLDTTLGLTDASKHFLHPSADITARTLTIPANAAVAFPIGTVVTVVNHSAAGVLSIAITTDTLRMAGPGTLGTRTLAANGMCTIMKLTATEWIISGVGLT